MAKLFWLQPDNTIVEFPLKAEQNLIGRSSRCDVRIKHPGISAEHALIRVLSGAATVEDLNSTNGTRVNGRRIESHTLRHGDQIGVGRERLMYFAELDEASRFAQPESIEPFAQPAPGGETVNTGAPSAVSGVEGETALPSRTPATRPAALNVALELPPPTTGAAGVPTVKAGRKAANPAIRGGGMPELDPALLASLPRGTTLTSPPAVPRAATVPRVHALTASIAVLSGPAVGKRYPLDQASVTLGKEGKQVIELVRGSPTRWQLRQREGVTPAYVNGDALAGARDLVAGDVIELVGVRLRFEIALADEPEADPLTS